MSANHTPIPADILAELNADAAAAGFTAKRADARNSRWEYQRKLLALGRQYRHLISLPR